MYQLRVVAFCVQKVILLPFAVRAPTWLDDRFWKFLIELIDMKVHFWNFKSLVLVVQFGPKLSFLVVLINKNKFLGPLAPKMSLFLIFIKKNQDFSIFVKN